MDSQLGRRSCKRGAAPALVLVSSILLLVLVGPSNSWGKSRARYGGSVSAYLWEEPLGIDPLALRHQSEVTLVRLVFDTLYQREGGKVVPHLALALPDRSIPGQARIPLRQGVALHSGATLKGRDIAASLKRLLASEWSQILEGVDEVRLEGSDLLLIGSSISSNIALSLSDVRTSITPGGKRPSFRRAVGTGPFRFKARRASAKEVRLEAFDNHFAGRSYLDRVRLRWTSDAKAEVRDYETGKIDLSSKGKVAFAGHQPKFPTSSIEKEPSVLVYLGVGKAHSFLGKESFRNAISSALSRFEMRATTSGAAIEPSLAPVLGAGPTVTGPKFSLAQKLFAQLRTEIGGTELKIGVNSSRIGDSQIASRIAAALFRFGIVTKIVSLSAAEFRDSVKNGKLDLFIEQVSMGALSPRAQYIAAYLLHAVGNSRDLQRTLKRTSLSNLVRKFEVDLPIIPLFHQGLRVHFRQDLLDMEWTPDARLRFESLHFDQTQRLFTKSSKKEVGKR